MSRRAWLVAYGLLAVAVLAGIIAFTAGGDEDDDTSTAATDQPAAGAVPSGEEGGAHQHGGAAVDPAANNGWHGALLTRSEPRPAFTLTDTSGRAYSFGDATRGRLTLLFFGYTNCPDVCPLHMATLQMALERPGMPDPAVVFVTTDPQRDTPERLREWLDGFGDDIVGLTGTPEEIAAAERAAGVEGSYPVSPDGSPAPTTGPGNYEVGHAAQVVAYTPDDMTHIVYPSGVQADDWAADLPRLADGTVPTPAG